MPTTQCFSLRILGFQIGAVLVIGYSPGNYITYPTERDNRKNNRLKSAGVFRGYVIVPRRVYIYIY